MYIRITKNHSSKLSTMMLGGGAKVYKWVPRVDAAWPLDREKSGGASGARVRFLGSATFYRQRFI